MQIHAAFLAAWQRILAMYGGDYAGGGVVYEDGLVLPPYRDGTSAHDTLLTLLATPCQ